MMKDKNGVEIVTGQIVEITGAFFKNDNGLYFVDRSPGDAGWSGNDYSLKKISKTGKISKAKNNICFWPISACVSSRAKAIEANAWNREHAEIEVTSVRSMAEVKNHFTALAAEAKGLADRAELYYGEDSSDAKNNREREGFFTAVAASIA